MNMITDQNQTKHRFGGAIPLLRKFQQHPFWTERRKFSRAEAWIDLLYMARYGTETEEICDRGEFIQIQYAQILTSIITLSKKWRRSRAWVNKLIKMLEKKQSILIIIMNKRRTILQIVNMGRIKKILQGNEHQLLQQYIPQIDQKKTYKDKEDIDNKERINIIPVPQDHKQSYKDEIHLLISYLTNKLGRMFPNYGKQARYVKSMLASKYCVEDIKWAIDVMLKDKWWGEHSFDMKNVADEIPKLMTRTFKGGTNRV